MRKITVDLLGAINPTALSATPEATNIRTGGALPTSYCEGFGFLFESAQQDAPPQPAIAKTTPLLGIIDLAMLVAASGRPELPRVEIVDAKLAEDIKEGDDEELLAMPVPVDVPAPAPLPLPLQLTLTPQLDVVSQQGARSPAPVLTSTTPEISETLEVIDDQVQSFSATITKAAADPKMKEIALVKPEAPDVETPPAPQIKDAKPVAAVPRVAPPQHSASSSDTNTDSDQRRNEPNSQSEPAVLSSFSAEAPTPASSFREATKVAETNRVSAETQTNASEPVRSVDVKLGEEGAQVRLRVVEQGGEIKAFVTSSSPQLSEQLRAELPELSRSLNDSGYHSDIKTPEVTRMSSASDLQQSSEHNDPNHQDAFGGSAGQESGRQQQGRDTTPEDPESTTTFEKEMVTAHG